MKRLLVIAALFIAVEVSAQTVDTVYFGRQTLLGNTASSGAELYGEAALMYQYTPDAAHTCVAKRWYARVKNYINQASTLSIGLYTVSGGLPDDSVWSVEYEMSAEEQTGSDQWIHGDCNITLTFGTTYTTCSGENTNGMYRILSTAVDTTGGLTDTANTDHDIFPPRSASRQTSPTTLSAQWTDAAAQNSHPVIYWLVERTQSSAKKKVIVVQ